jgi:hypothetical protein
MGYPLRQSIVGGGRGAEVARHLLPLGTGPRQPDQAMEATAIVAAGTARLRARLGDDEQGLEVGPQGIGDLPQRRVVGGGG